MSATEQWECGPHANAWGGHDARCRRVPATTPTEPVAEGDCECGHPKDQHYALGYSGCHGMPCSCRLIFRHREPVAEGVEGLAAVLAEHRWLTTIWGDGGGGFGWKCSCGIVDWGTGAENPARYVRYETPEAAALGAVQHIAIAQALRPRSLVKAVPVETLRRALAAEQEQA